MIRTLITLAIVFGCVGRLLSAQPDEQAVAFFETKIRPLFHQHCIECHSDSEPESGLSLESYAGLMRGGKLGAAITPGKPKESLLISAVNHDEFLKMPPKSKLTAAELAALSQWVTMGAPWPDKRDATQPDNTPAEVASEQPVFTEQQKAFWAYQPLVRPEVPQLALDYQPSSGSAIDGLINAQLQRQAIIPNGPAGRYELLRRLTYDLTGLAPTVDELEAFVADPSPLAYVRVVDRLMASPRYGEKWGRHWLDVARYADSNGLDENIGYPHAFRYRDYVIDSLNNDKPYSRFVQEQVAGDLLPDDPNSLDNTPFDRQVATAFLAIGAKMLAEDDPVKMQMDIIDEQLSVLCQAFMGMTIGCARCHDHKYDPLTAADYYALAGIFKSSQTMANHNVVAKLFERQLADPVVLAEARRIDERLEAARGELNKLNQSVAERTKQELRSTISQALQATLAYEKFIEASARSSQSGANHTDSQGRSYNAAKSNQSYSVENGYALIEAEGFHRGSANRDHSEYGRGLGIVNSSGNADMEFDIDIQRPGNYAIELRYAAVERRPLRLKVDNVEINPRVATETSGSWYAEGQIWTVAGLARLTPGKHVVRLESRRAFPHVDKLAIVYQVAPGTDWPFGQLPIALSHTGASAGISFPVLSLWRNHLNEIRRSTKEDARELNFYGLWFALANPTTDFPGAVANIQQRLLEDSALRAQTPELLRDPFVNKHPQSLAELAELYAVATERALAAGDQDQALKQLREHILAKASPLNGPTSDYQRYYTAIEDSQAEQIQMQLTSIEAERPKFPAAMGVGEAKPEDLKIHLRGSHLVLGKLVARGMPKILSGPDDPVINQEGSGRLQLAQWLTRRDHPLTSRVIVNRLWHWHFGRGLVPTTDNFGVLGLPPTHPELLDWLATELVDHDWSLKHVHRQILLSDVYQRSSRTVAANDVDAQRVQQCQTIDPENQWLWHFRRRRLTAEEARDSILGVGLGLNLTMHGSLMKTASHQYVNSAVGGDLDYSQPRRSVYLPVIRSGVLDEMQTLDFPDPAMITGERQTSTVAPQALMMMNSDLVLQQTLAAANQLLSTSADTEQRIAQAYQRILRRAPRTAELEAATNFLSRALDQGHSAAVVWQSLCRVLVASNEFMYIE